MNLKVIYEDNHLLVVEKPANIPVQADSSGDTDLLTLAKSYVKEKYNKPGDVYLGLVQRLDRPVSGVIVFARTSKAAARLTESFKKRQTKKQYVAVVEGEAEYNAEYNDWLLKNERTNTSMIVPEGTPGAKNAQLEAVKVTSRGGRSLVDVLLHSGRHHQIRVQLSGHGFPIFGDQRYNRLAKPGQQIALHAYSLTIEHPTLKTQMTFTCTPGGDSFESFKEEIDALCWGIRCSYIDKNIVCVNKQAGLACTVADEGESAIEASLAHALNQRIYPVHRLDVLTSGLVLFARNEMAEKLLSDAIRDRRIRKTYLAEVFGCPKNTAGRLILYGKKSAVEAKMTVYERKVEGAVEMISDYRVVERRGDRSLVEIGLVTGRTHQIRASMAHIGCPLIGDDKYGDRALNRKEKNGLHLTAIRIEFPRDMGELSMLSGLVIETGAAF